jgi:hypothetical protein
MIPVRELRKKLGKHSKPVLFLLYVKEKETCFGKSLPYS